MYVASTSEAAELPDAMRRALDAFAREPTAHIPTADLIHALFARDLIEWTHGGIRFTEHGRRIFHELRQQACSRGGSQESKSAELFPSHVQQC